MSAKRSSTGPISTTWSDARPPCCGCTIRSPRWAATNSTVLVTGETGTGKELVARAVHRRSRRRDGPLVTVNCGGAVADARRKRAVRARARRLHRRDIPCGSAASSSRTGGTLFLDEVGELPEEMQVKLLRVLQTGEVERLGSTRTRRVDVRLIAATNRDAHGRGRAGQIPRGSLLPAPRLSRSTCRRCGSAARTFRSSWRTWPSRKGKVVGKTHRLHPGSGDAALDAVLLAGQRARARERHRARDHPVPRWDPASRRRVRSERADGVAPTSRSARHAAGTTEQGRFTLREVERAHIVKVCEDCGWRIKGPDSASVRLGLKPSTLYFRMHKLGIVRSA